MLKAMQDKNALLEVRMANGSYLLPATEIQIDSISKQLGSQVKLSDIIVHIDIAKSNSTTLKLLEQASVKERFTVIASPIDFSLTALYNDQRANIDEFNTYVGREIPIPDGANPLQVTTAVVLEADGTVRHVPTYVVNRDGKHFAVIHSLTNSTYALIEHSISFTNVKGHWPNPR
jgi:hypothetical protein